MRTRSALIACSPTAYPSHRTEQPCREAGLFNQEFMQYAVELPGRSRDIVEVHAIAVSRITIAHARNRLERLQEGVAQYRGPPLQDLGCPDRVVDVGHHRSTRWGKQLDP